MKVQMEYKMEQDWKVAEAALVTSIVGGVAVAQW